MSYFPFLKAKRGELLALSNAQDEEGMTPVLDIPASSKEADGEKLLSRLETVHKQIKKCLKKDFLFYIDHFDLNLDSRLPGNSHPLEFHEHLIKEGYNIGFVTGLDRDAEYNLQVRQLIEEYEIPILLRLLVDDFEVPRLIESEIDDLLVELGIQSDKIKLVLDLRVCTNASFEENSDAAIKFLNFIEDKYSFPGIIITSSLFPSSLNDLLNTGEELLCPRVENEVWCHIKTNYSGDLKVFYGDYAVVSPEFMDFDFKGPPPIAPKAIYTSLNEYFIKRCKSVQHDVKGYGQYIDIAKTIVNLAWFRNPTYSFGDNFIYQKSTGLNKTGNPEQWITATVNQHIIFIMRSFPSIYGT